METIEKKNYFILVGTSGTGKTTLLEYLKNKEFACNQEVTRQVLTNQLEVDGPALPAKNPTLFVKLMLEYSIKNFKKSSPNNEPVFFDRGIPDLIAYSIRFGVDPTEFKEASQKYLYNKKVFVFPPWAEIFVNDDLRGGSFEMYSGFHDLLLKAYQEHGYELIQVPYDSVEARAKFILEHTQAAAKC